MALADQIGQPAPMPYRWSLPDDADSAAADLRLWPHQSLGRHGFVAFFTITAALVSLPLLVVIGSAVLWMLLPFVSLTFAAMWLALRRNARDGTLVEDLAIRRDGVTLTHRPAAAPARRWQALPDRIRVLRYEESGPVPNYLVLEGGPRPVEIGRFLTPEERHRLEHELRQRLRAAVQRN